MARQGSSNKVSNGLLVASSAAVLAVYSAGYVRTRSAADRLEAQFAERRRPVHVQPAAAPVHVETPAAPAVTPDAQPPAVEPGKTAQKEAPPAPEPAQKQTRAPAVAAPAPVEVASAAAPVPVEAPPPPPPAAPAPPKPTWKDGTYTGWGHCRHGDIEATVIIADGRITKASISQCLTRYACDIIDPLIPQVVQRQSFEVDTVGGATQSADAFYYAVQEALTKAKAAPAAAVQ